MELSKECSFCGKKFYKRKKDSRKRFLEQRRFCSVSCRCRSYKGRRYTKKPINKILVMGNVCKMELYNIEGAVIAHTIFDTSDYKKVAVCRWCLKNKKSKRYKTVGTDSYPGDKKKVFLHRLITGATKGLFVDHINHDTLDNRQKNLRLVTRTQNSMNNRSRGYSWHKGKKVFSAYIRVNKKLISLGSFKRESDAIKARGNAEKRYFREYRNKNK